MIEADVKSSTARNQAEWVPASHPDCALDRGVSGRSDAIPASTFADCALVPAAEPVEPVIDLAHLSRMTLGEKTLEAEVLALFDRQAGILLGRMRQATPAAVGAFAHTLKGSARGIGAWQVAAAAEMVERLAAERGPADLADVLDQLAAATNEACATIADLLAAR